MVYETIIWVLITIVLCKGTCWFRIGDLIWFQQRGFRTERVIVVLCDLCYRSSLVSMSKNDIKILGYNSVKLKLNCYF